MQRNEHAELYNSFLGDPSAEFWNSLCNHYILITTAISRVTEYIGRDESNSIDRFLLLKAEPFAKTERVLN